MKKYLIIIISCMAFTACTRNISSYNEEKKKAANVPASTLFSNGVRNLTDALVSPNVNTNVLRLTVQHWATTTYQDEPNYDFTTRNIPQLWWRTLYRDVLIDLQEAKRLIPDDITISEVTKKNRIAITDIMQVYTFSVLVNTFGNVPYTEALDFNTLFPKYDDAKTIYDDLLTRLDADIASMSTTDNGFAAADDLVYGSIGSASDRVAAWIKFANTLKVKLAMTIVDADAAKAKTAVEQASSKAFQSASDNAIFKYQGGTPNTNPLWKDLVESKRADFVAGEALVNTMKTLADPRLTLYYKPNDAGEFIGGIQGSQNTYTLFAKPSDKLSQIDLPAVLLDYTELEFYRAEALERGFAVGGTAAEHYANGIRSSVVYWGGTTAAADAFIAKPEVNYATAPGTYKQKIGMQKWIALYNRPFDAWTEKRRLDYPSLTVPVLARSGYPNRLTYPTNEQTLNGTNYTQASSTIGGDKVETKLFWDKF